VSASSQCSHQQPVLLSPWNNYRTGVAGWSHAGWYAYLGLSRTAWAVSLAFFAVPFALGYGDFVRSFLGASFWTPLARLTFGAYLIHPVFLAYFVASITTQLRYSFGNWMMWSCYAVIVSYGLSFISFLVLEKPLMNLEMLVIRLLKSSSHRGEDQDRRAINDLRE
jgi:peptidoglycan/LPS O-acetylase OafA/YrhL